MKYGVNQHAHTGLWLIWMLLIRKTRSDSEVTRDGIGQIENAYRFIIIFCAS